MSLEFDFAQPHELELGNDNIILNVFSDKRTVELDDDVEALPKNFSHDMMAGNLLPGMPHHPEILHQQYHHQHNHHPKVMVKVQLSGEINVHHYLHIDQ